MGAHGCKDDAYCRSHVSCPIVHRDAEGPVVGAREFFVSQARMRRISDQSFELLPEFDPDFFGQVI